MIEYVEQLIQEINDHGAINCKIEVYDDKTGKQYEMTHAYIDEGVFCVDIRPVTDA